MDGMKEGRKTKKESKKKGKMDLRRSRTGKRRKEYIKINMKEKREQG
jgi:hypothetical protein